MSLAPCATQPVLPPAAQPLLRLLSPGDWALHPLPTAQDPALESRAVLRLQQGAPATLYLPGNAGSHWCASVAHAAAHRRFGGPPQPRQGLKPVQQALLGVLEDARIEALACAELPGLRAWWRPHHNGEHARRGQGFEDLLARLSTCLLDAALDDPHPWIARVRQLFFERDGCTLALRTPAALRAAASHLGNDIGQMRLPFNARTYQVHAPYRDDNTHLWLPSEEDREALTLPEVREATDPPAPPTPPAPADWPLEQPVASYPEWDHRIGRYRPAWVQVHEQGLSRNPVTSEASALVLRRLMRQHPRSLLGVAAGRDRQGDTLHPVALVDHAVARRSGQPPEAHVWSRPAARRATQAVLLLVDASVSTATELAHWQHQVQQVAWALQRMGHVSAVWGFGSDGRHRVRLQRLKGWDERCETTPWGALQAGGSTRLGAALRHAGQLCRQGVQQQRAEGCSVLLLTDGELHDIDVHDSAYLPADLAQAVRELRAQGIGVQALVSGPAQVLKKALGARQCWPVHQGAWGAALSQALAGLGRAAR